MTNLEILKLKLNLRYSIDSFTNEDSARSTIAHSVKNCWLIVLGDNNKFWVVCFADAAKLERAGYEVL